MTHTQRRAVPPPSSKTAGQEADEKAFEEMLNAMWGSRRFRASQAAQERKVARFAFDWAKDYGQQLRGCCHEHDPKTVAVAVAQEVEEIRDAEA